MRDKLPRMGRTRPIAYEETDKYAAKHKLRDADGNFDRTDAFYLLFDELLADRNELEELKRQLENGKPKTSLASKPQHSPSQAETDYLLKHPCAQFRRIIRQGLEVCNQKIKLSAECQACQIPKIKLSEEPTPTAEIDQLENKTDEVHTEVCTPVQTEEPTSKRKVDSWDVLSDEPRDIPCPIVRQDVADAFISKSMCRGRRSISDKECGSCSFKPKEEEREQHVCDPSESEP